jgi:hypothetical protein
LFRLIASLVSCAILAAGCASGGTANVDAAHRPTASGVLVVSATASGPMPGTLWYQIVRAHAVTQNVASIAVNDRAQGLDWEPGDPEVPNGGTGRVAVIELAPGEYELRRWVMNGGARGGAFSSRRPFGYRFVIEPGKVTYVGNVHVDLQRTANVDTVPYRMSVNDQRERDLAIVRRKHPAVAGSPIVFAGAAQGRRDDIFEEERGGDPVRTSIDDLNSLLPRK